MSISDFEIRREPTRNELDVDTVNRSEKGYMANEYSVRYATCYGVVATIWRTNISVGPKGDPFSWS